MDERILEQIFYRYKGETGFVIVTWEEFRDLVVSAYPLLIGAAKKERLITYGEVGRKIGLFIGSEYFQLKIGFVVGACSEYEAIEGRPLISAIVVNSNTKYPGQGFWGLSRVPDNIRLDVKYSDIESGYKMTPEMLDFWTSEVQAIFDWWRVSN